MAVVRARGFAPIAGRRPRVLILGSMPGRASLAAGQYYAHPRNAFWKISAALLHFDPHADYNARVRALESAGIALWDVLRTCVRRGSLDAEIERDSEIANDFARFFRRHDTIARVFFNGARAEASYRRHVLPGIGANLVYTRLPSTSPAHASASYASKLGAWCAILRR